MKIYPPFFRNKLIAATILIAAILIALICVVIIVGGGAGLKDKTLWNWMELLIIPVAIGLGTWWFNREEKKTDRELAVDRQRQEALVKYFEQMSELLLKEKLVKSQKGDEVREVARVLTLSVLRGLDGDRKGEVVKFLYESGLINKKKPVIDLAGANLRSVKLTDSRIYSIDLSKADLSDSDLQNVSFQSVKFIRTILQRANLNKAHITGVLVTANLNEANLEHATLGGNLTMARLNRANLYMADLIGLKLKGARLEESNLIKAALIGADLKGAIFKKANLKKTRVTPEQLNNVKSLENATMPDGTRYEKWVSRGRKAWDVIDSDLPPDILESLSKAESEDN